MNLRDKIIFGMMSTLFTMIFVYWIYIGSVWKQERCDRPDVQCDQ